MKMKKIVLVLLAALLVAAPLVAAPKLNLSKAAKGRFGLGLNAGTNNGLALRFDNRDWDLYLNLGYAIVTANSWGFSGEIGAEFPVYDIKGVDGRLHIDVGGQVPLMIASSAFHLGVLGTAALNYEFPKVPIHTFLRIGLGVNMGFVDEFKLFFGSSGALGFVYLF